MRVPQFEFSIRVCQPSREFGERHPVCVSAVDRPTRLRPIPRTALADTAADRKQRPYIVALAAGRYWPGPKVAGELTFTSQHSLLRQKRLRWVGHALRRKDGDLSKDTVKQELARKSSTWTACVLSDMEALNIGGVVALEREANNRESFRKLTSAYTQK